MCKDIKSISYGKRKSVLFFSTFISNVENFKSLPIFGGKNYRKLLYAMVEDATKTYTTNDVWKLRFSYPEEHIPNYRIEKLVPIMEECLRRVMEMFANDIEEKINSEDKKILAFKESHIKILSNIQNLLNQ